MARPDQEEDVLYGYVDADGSLTQALYATGGMDAPGALASIRSRWGINVRCDPAAWFPLGLFPGRIAGRAASALFREGSTYHSFCPVYDRGGRIVAALVKRTVTEIERRQARG